MRKGRWIDEDQGLRDFLKPGAALVVAHRLGPQQQRRLRSTMTGSRLLRDCPCPNPYDFNVHYLELLSISQAQLADLADIDTEEVEQLFAREEGYANPKIHVCCAVFDDAGRVLLIREAADGRWSLPGGWTDIGASPAENAMCEVREESGYAVTIERLLAIWDMPKHGHPPLCVPHLESGISRKGCRFARHFWRGNTCR
jgi:hypothetical protein